jgi:hypothetical protein
MLKDDCFIEQAPKTLGRVHGALIGPPRKNAPKAPRPAVARPEDGDDR